MKVLYSLSMWWNFNHWYFSYHEWGLFFSVFDQLFLWRIALISFGYTLRSGISGLFCRYMLNIRDCQIIFQHVSFYTPTGKVQKFQLVYVLAIISYDHSKILSCTLGICWYLIVILIYILYVNGNFNILYELPIKTFFDLKILAI
jgi:hypothetical protein